MSVKRCIGLFSVTELYYTGTPCWTKNHRRTTDNNRSHISLYYANHNT